MLKPGTVILYKDGPTFVSKIIRLIQGNKITHCSIVILSDKKDPYILEIESLFETVQVKQLSQTFKYTDEIYAATNSDIEFPEHIPNIGLLVAHYSYRKYSLLALINATINHFFGLFNSQYMYKSFFNTEEKYTCSSLVADVLTKISAYKCEDISLVEPDDFTKSPWKIHRIEIN